MSSKDPSTTEEELDRDEKMKAIGNVLATEVETLNSHLQQNELIKDPQLKRIHDKITREKIAQLEELLRTLGKLSRDSNQIEINLREEYGSRERTHKNLTLGLPTPLKLVEYSGWDWDPIGPLMESVNSNRVVFELGSIVSSSSTTISLSEVSIGESVVQTKVLSTAEIPYVSLEVKFNSGHLSEMRRVAAIAGKTFTDLENNLLLKGHPFSIYKLGTEITGVDWSQPGNVLNDVVRGYEVLASGGFEKDISILMSPSTFSKTFRVVDRTGTYEIEMIKEIGKVIATNAVGDREIVLLSKRGFEIVVNTSLSIEHIGKERNYHVYLLSEQLAPRLVDKSAACVIRS
ncbi:MAG: encapsulin [Metallosphaera sp.]